LGRAYAYRPEQHCAQEWIDLLLLHSAEVGLFVCERERESESECESVKAFIITEKASEGVYYNGESEARESR